MLANDNDPDGDPLTIGGFTLPAHGQLTFNADQTFTYTPAPDFVGEDGFAYTISDGRGGTAQAEVTLVVAWPNQAPVAVDDRSTTTQGAPVTIDILANDSDADGDPLPLVALTMPVYGLLTVNLDQSITYTPACRLRRRRRLHLHDRRRSRRPELGRGRHRGGRRPTRRRPPSCSTM